MKIFDQYGSYQLMSFTGQGVQWKLVGSYTNDPDSYSGNKPVHWSATDIGKTIDEFKNPEGKFIKIKRKDVYAKELAGDIQGVIEFIEIKVKEPVKKSQPKKQKK